GRSTAGLPAAPRRWLVVAPKRQRPRSPREEPIDSRVPLSTRRQLTEPSRLEREPGIESLREPDAHDLDDRGGGRGTDNGVVMRDQPDDLGVALDVRKCQRRPRVGERRKQRAAEFAGGNLARDAERV